MAKFDLLGFNSVLALIICSHAIFNPLQAWIDHIFDFHLDVNKENGWKGQEQAERDNSVWAEIGRSQENDRTTSEGKGTNTNQPDRDK